MTLEEAHEIDLSLAAVDQYVREHGGTRRQAEAHLRAMVEDFVLAGHPAVRARDRRRLVMAHAGFALLISPDRQVVLAYTTQQRQRTWAQVKAGLPSSYAAARWARRHSRLAGVYPPIGKRADPQPPLPEPDAVRSVPVDQIHVSTWAVRCFVKWTALPWEPGQDVDELHSAVLDELHTALRSAPVEWRPGEPRLDRGPRLLLRQPERTWVLRADGLEVSTLLGGTAAEGRPG